MGAPNVTVVVEGPTVVVTPVVCVEVILELSVSVAVETMVETSTSVAVETVVELSISVVVETAVDASRLLIPTRYPVLRPIRTSAMRSAASTSFLNGTEWGDGEVTIYY
jgi:hypothetical protein